MLVQVLSPVPGAAQIEYGEDPYLEYVAPPPDGGWVYPSAVGRTPPASVVPPAPTAVPQMYYTQSY